MNWRSGLLLCLGGLFILGIGMQKRIPQDLAYFLFADPKTLLGIPNFFNVLSNLPFLVVGYAGLRLVTTRAGAVTADTRTAWLVFFFGILLTAFGSGYFHLWPSNATLIWDRLPMTIGFMSLVTIIIAEYLSPKIGRQSLLPLLIVGALSVGWWAYTESVGDGDLRPYAAVQFLPMLLIPLVAILYRGRSDLGRYIPWLIGFYLAAKLAEYFDSEIYAMTGVLSGHSIKHVLASFAPAALLAALMARIDRASPGTEKPR